MQLLSEVLAEGKQAIVLIPEIALTFQTVSRFQKRFPGRVSVLHSRLSEGERADQIEMAKNGDIDIMIGPRSALFTPFERLGIIIMDEEHETSYISESSPRYHTDEVAVYRAKLAGASVVLGSATPSVKSYQAAKEGRYKEYRLTKRAGTSKHRYRGSAGRIESEKPFCVQPPFAAETARVPCKGRTGDVIY